MHLDFALLVSTVSPILGPTKMRIAAIRVIMDKLIQKNGVVTPLKAGSVAPAQRLSDGPDPRLVKLVRLLAQRAARQWYEKMLRERGQPRS
jgi:hypothetical protein